MSASVMTTNNCHLCGSLLGVVFEWNGLDLCAPCCGKQITAGEYQRLRAIPQPPKSYTTLKQAEFSAIAEVMRRGMNIKDSAAALGTTRATLYSKLKEYGIERN